MHLKHLVLLYFDWSILFGLNLSDLAPHIVSALWEIRGQMCFCECIVAESYPISNQNHDDISAVVKIEHDPENGDMRENTGNTIDWGKGEYDQPLTNYCLTDETVQVECITGILVDLAKKSSRAAESSNLALGNLAHSSHPHLFWNNCFSANGKYNNVTMEI